MRAVTGSSFSYGPVAPSAKPKSVSPFGADYTQYTATPNQRRDSFNSCIEPILDSCPTLTVSY